MHLAWAMAVVGEAFIIVRTCVSVTTHLKTRRAGACMGKSEMLMFQVRAETVGLKSKNGEGVNM